MIAPALMLVLGLATTMAGAIRVQLDAVALRDRELEMVADHIAKEVELGMRSNTGVLRAAAAFVESSELVTEAEWQQFAARLEMGATYPGLNGLAFVRLVETPRIGEFESWMRANGVPGFTVRSIAPADADGDASGRAAALPGDGRASAMVVMYHAPGPGGESLSGLDITSDRVALETYLGSALHDTSVMSRPTGATLDGYALSTIIAHPVVRPSGTTSRPAWAGGRPVPNAPGRELTGWVASPLMQDAFFEGLNGLESHRFAVDFYPGAGHPPVSHTQRREIADLGDGSRTMPRMFTIDGQRYTVRVRPLDVDANHVQETETWMTALAGTTITGLATMIVCVMSRTNDRATRLAVEMTRSLASSEREQRLLAERAEAASVAKGRFIANVSHEIRTPITAILGYTEILVDHVASRGVGVGEDAESAIASISGAGNHLLHLVNDILDASQLESGNARVDPVATDLGPLILASLRMVQTRAYEKGLELGVEVAPGVGRALTTDPQRFRQILVNLLGNAVKFTRAGSVTVSVRVEDATLCVAVRDTGVGIAEADLDRLFRAFSQVDSSPTRRHEGTGLGLSISMRYAEMLGGTIAVDSTPGGGSTFELRLPAPGPGESGAELEASVILDGLLGERPLARRVGIGQGAPGAPPGHAGPARTPAAAADPVVGAGAGAGARRSNGAMALVVDDSADNRRLISHFLGRAGWAVEFAENGREAVEMVASGTSYAVIIMDVQMPVMDGPTAIRTIRDIGERTPIVSLTANSGAKERAMCMEAGSDAFLTKPVDRRALIAECARLTGLNPSGDAASRGAGGPARAA